MKAGPASVEEYIARFSPPVQAMLQTLRATIREAAPEAVERISYQMPAFAWKGILVYFAAWEKHLGFYPTASGMAAFREELSAFETSKGTVRFSLNQPLPLDLVRRIVQFRLRENQAKGPLKEAP